MSLAIDDIRLALNQNQPLGNGRFYSMIARMTGERRQARPRGRPRAAKAAGLEGDRGSLGFERQIEPGPFCGQDCRSREER